MSTAVHSPPSPGARHRVVLVEDDPRFAARFQAVLQRAADIELCAMVDTGTAALQYLRDHAPDLLLVDLGLPDISGLEVIREGARHHPNCDIVVITIYGDEGHVIQSIEAGATGYLLKDADPEDLLAQLRTLRAGGSPISPVIARQLLRRTRNQFERSSAVTGDRLSEREQKVLELVAKGYSYVEIARLLEVSPHTVMTYVKRTYRKLQVGSKTEAVYEARKMGLLRD